MALGYAVMHSSTLFLVAGLCDDAKRGATALAQIWG
jgi:hypothetical protein